MELSLKDRPRYQKDENARSKEDPASKGLILCVETHRDTTDLLIFMLKMSGYKAICCETVTSALEFAFTYRFDLYLITDYFSDGQGLELIKKLRCFNKRTPLIYFSTMIFPHNMMELISADTQAILAKPNGINELIVTIDNLIEKTRHQTNSQ